MKYVDIPVSNHSGLMQQGKFLETTAEECEIFKCLGFSMALSPTNYILQAKELDGKSLVIH